MKKANSLKNEDAKLKGLKSMIMPASYRRYYFYNRLIGRRLIYFFINYLNIYEKRDG